MATLIRADGTTEVVKPAGGRKKFSLEEIQKMVGGYVDIQKLPAPVGGKMAVNDEGKLVGLPMNARASEIWQSAYPIEEYPLNNDGAIAGDVVVFEKGSKEF